MDKPLLVLVLCALVEGDVFIRTRTEGDEVVTEDSIPTYFTLSVPPFTSDFHKGSRGLSYDVIEAIQYEIGQINGRPLDASNYTVLLEDSVSCGIIEVEDGMYRNIIDRRAHWGVGPFPTGYSHRSAKIFKIHDWLKVTLKLIVDNQSRLAVFAKEFNHFNTLTDSFDLDKEGVQLIFVKDSAEFQFFNNTRNIIPRDYLDVSDWLKRTSNHPILVSTICEGIQKLLDYNGDELSGDGSKKTAALVTTDLIADHYAKGNKHLKVIDVNLKRNQSHEQFMSYNIFSWMPDGKSNTLRTAVHNIESKLNTLKWRWMDYDENACVKMKGALKSASSVVGVSWVLMVVEVVSMVILWVKMGC